MRTVRGTARSTAPAVGAPASAGGAARGSPIAVAVLGPIAAARAGTAVDLGAPRQRAVLAALALGRGRPVAVDTIVDQVWGGAPPPGVGTTLQGYVAALRRALEPDRPSRAPAGVLVTAPPGYALCADDLDVAGFEAEVGAAHAALAGLEPLGRPALAGPELEQAVARSDAALARWRGTPYAELPDAPQAAAERTRLDELRLMALEDRAVACLALGRHVTVVAEIEGLVASHPLRERLWELLAIGLSRCGRHAEALDALRRVRELLDEELGLRPSPALQQLQSALLRHDPALAWVAPSSPAVRLAAAPDASDDRRTAPVTDTAVGEPPVAPWPLCGRERELTRLLEALDTVLAEPGGTSRASERASAAAPVCVALTGEPGIGKSRLAAELAVRARAAGVRVLRGRCSQDDGAPPLWPWRAVLAGLGVAAEEDEVAAEDVGAAFRVWERICAHVIAAAERRPLLLLLDDLHWADPSSLRVLRLLVETAPLGSRLLVVATWRRHPPPDGALADLAETLARQHAVRLDLEGLGPEATAALFEAVAEREPGPDTAARLHETTEGNPFFLVEYARLAAAHAEAGVPAQVPAAVSDVLRRRIDRLPPDGVRVLRLAAVLGRRFDLPTLAAVTGLAEDDLLDALDPAVIAGLVREDGIDRFVFGHALVRDALRSGLPSSRRARAHAAVAAALAGVAGRETEVARHWLAAGPSYADRAWPAAAGAAAVARRLHAYEEAADLLRAALAAMDEDPAAGPADRYAVLMALVDAYRWSAQQPLLARCAEEAIASARLMDDPEAVARAACSATQSVLWRSAPPGETNAVVVGALRESLAGLSGPDDALRCRAMLALANEIDEDAEEERSRLVEEATAMARRLDDPVLVLDACLVGFVALWVARTVGERRDKAVEAMTLARATGREHEYVVAATLHAVVLGELGLPPQMWAAAQVAREAARRLRIPFAEMVLHGMEVPWLALAGEFEECERRMAELASLSSRMSHSDVDEAVLGCTLVVRLWQGRAGEMLPVLRRLSGQMMDFAPSIAVYLWRAGHHDEAREQVERHVDWFAHDRPVPLPTLGHTAEMSLYLGLAEVGVRCAERLAAHADLTLGYGSVLALGPVSAYLAMAQAAAGEREAARAWADRALAFAREHRLTAFADWYVGLRAQYDF